MSKVNIGDYEIVDESGKLSIRAHGTNESIVIDNGEVESLTSKSVETDALTDASDGGAWETLRGAGFEKGDWIPFYQCEVAAGYSETTSTTFVPLSGRNGTMVFDWDDTAEDGTYAMWFIGETTAPTRLVETDIYGGTMTVLGEEVPPFGGSNDSSPKHIFDQNPTGVKEYGIEFKAQSDGSTGFCRQLDIVVGVQL